MVTSSPPDSPYKGLLPYSEQDAPFFFGRDTERELIIANLQAARLTLLYGASGVGKSSVLRAGVAYRLQQAAQKNIEKRGTPGFVVVYFNAWRDDPNAALAECVRQAGTQALPGKPFQPLSPPPTLRDLLQAWTEHLGSRLLIILDQFEEYFLYHEREDGEGTFAFEFPRAVNRPDLRASFLISIREDALASLDRFKGRIPNLFDNYLRIGHLNRAAAREAIVKPLAQYNLMHPEGERVEIEPALVDAVLAQVKTGEVVLGEGGRGATSSQELEGPIETPFLQLVLVRLWNEELGAGSHVLRLETLNRLGGAQRIVRTHLDAAMNALSPEQQEVAARVFRYLVTPSGTKIALTVPDLAALAELPEPQITAVLEKLSSGQVRILRPVAPPPDQPTLPRYEIFHDVIAPAILDWRSRFIQRQARAEAEKKAAADKAEAERQLALQFERRRTRLVTLGLGIVSVLLLAAVVFALFALQQRQTAIQEQTASQAREAAASAVNQLGVDPERAVLLAIASVQQDYTFEGEDALRQSLLAYFVHVTFSGHAGRLLSVSYSPDGMELVTASEDKTARVWAAAIGQQLLVLQGHTQAVRSARFSPDGKTILTASEDGTVRLWDAATGRALGVLIHGDTPFLDAEYSPDGRYFITGGRDGTARLWEAKTGSPVRVFQGHLLSVNTAQFSPDGKSLVTASDDSTARLWEVETGKLLYTLTGHSAQVVSAAFSPDGNRVVTASVDYSARIWNAADGRPLSFLRGHTNNVYSAAFSPDGKRVVTGSADQTARIWDAQTGLNLVTVRGHVDAVRSVVFDPTGRFVATASFDQTARVWDPDGGREGTVQHTAGGSLSSAIYTPDNKQFLTAGTDGSLTLWDSQTGAQARILVKVGVRVVPRGTEADVVETAFGKLSDSPDGKQILAVMTSITTTSSLSQTQTSEARIYDAATGAAQIVLGAENPSAAVFSPDGKRIATTSKDQVRIWDASTGTEVQPPLRGSIGAITNAAYSPDGKRLVVASQDNTAQVWDATTGARLVTLTGHRGIVWSAVYSPDGKFIVTASEDKTARIWDAQTGSAVYILSGHALAVRHAVFSPDGKYVLTASADRTARIWEATTGRLHSILRGHTAAVADANFSPSGEYVVTASADSTSRIYLTGIEDLVSLAQHRVGRELTCEEQVTYLHAEMVCPTPAP